MSRKIIKIIVVIIIIFTIIFGALFFVSGKKGTGNPIADIKSGAITFRDFSPFNPPAPTTPDTTSDGTTPVTPGNTPTTTPDGKYLEPKVRKVTDFAVSGFTYFEKERPIIPIIPDNTTVPETTTSATATSTTPPVPTPTQPSPLPGGGKEGVEKVTAIRYLEKSNAHIYDLFTDQKDAVIISNTTIPKIHEALFSPDGASVILRYLNETGVIQSYSATVPPPPADDILGSLKGVFLPEEILWLDMSPDGTKIFSLSSFDGGIVGDLSGVAGDKKIELIKSPFSEWLPSFVNSKTVTLTTKASSNIPGYLYSLNTGTKKMSRILGNIPGLTALMSPDEKHVLYAQTTASSITLSMYDTGTHETKDIGQNTLPEKCVWSKKGTTAYCAIPELWPNGTYPDDWYQGSVSFSDNIWQINIVGSIFSLTQITTSADLGGESIDAVNLVLDQNEHHLGLINKKDGTLWSIKL